MLRRPSSRGARSARRRIGRLFSSGQRTALPVQEHVVVDAELVDQRQVLVDGVDAERAGVVDAAQDDLLAVDAGSVPASGWWKPHRILISVDLPAPLSPISPSTSPLRQAQVDVAQRGHRAEPLGDVFDAQARSEAVRSGGSQSSRPPCAAQPGQVLVGDHRDEDRGAEDEEERVGADADEVEAVLQLGEDERAEQRADDGAGAAGEGGAADDRRRDRGEGDAGAAADVGVDGVDRGTPP